MSEEDGLNLDPRKYCDQFGRMTSGQKLFSEKFAHLQGMHRDAILTCLIEEVDRLYTRVAALERELPNPPDIEEDF